MHETLRSRVQRQIALEQECLDLGITRYRADRPTPWQTSPSAKCEADLPPGQDLTRTRIAAVSQGIRAFLEMVADGRAARHADAHDLLTQLDPEQAAMLAMRVMLNCAIDDNGLTQTAIQISDLLIDHIEMRDFGRARPHAFRTLARNQAKATYTSSKRRRMRALFSDSDVGVAATKVERVRVGTKLIEIVCEATGLFETFQERRREKMRWIVRPTDKLLNWLEKQHDRCEILRPVRMPMIVPPRRWRSPKGGGYLRLRGHHLIRNRPATYLDRSTDLSQVYSAVNAIQAVPWRINRRLHDVMHDVWMSGGALGNLPRHADIPMPPYPTHPSEDEHRAWKMKAAQVYRENAALTSRRLILSQRMWVADRLKSEAAIYFPHTIDFRGRVYPVATGGPHPQGDDISRSLLEFSEGRAITHEGAEWLAVHLANCFGIDKVSFDERREWLRAHEALILDSGNQPIDGERFWSTAEKPWQALAACMEWAGYWREGPDYVTRLPVHLDGTNSGLQHFTALLRDETSAQAVNLMPSDLPGDLYATVRDHIQAMAQASNDPAALLWREGRVTREVVKRPTMTFVYSATRYGFQEQVMRETNGEGSCPIERATSAKWMSYALWKGVAETVPSAARMMEWLREIGRLFILADLPVRWTSPVGLPVVQHYPNHKTSRVKCWVGGRRIELSLRVETSDFDRRAMVDALSPNFVHSLDGGHLMAVVNRCHRAGIPLTVIHDSFGSHPADVTAMTAILRDTFVEQYRPDVLARFRDEVAAQLPAEIAALIPPPPTRGNFDLETVRASKYLFH